MNSVQTAYEAIKKRLESGEWSPGERLPSLSKMADICAVSRTTMWRAVSLLQKESFLHARQRGAIIAGAAGVAPIADESKHELLWERLKRQIGKDVLWGAFSERLLPLPGKLALRYGVTPPTIRKVLAQLAKEGVVVAEGRRFKQPLGRSRAHKPTIVLFIEAGTIADDPRTREVIANLERECIRLGISFQLEPFASSNPAALLDVRRALTRNQVLRGCILSFWNPWDSSRRDRWFDLCALLAGRKIPTIVIDQNGELPIPEDLRRARHLRVLRICRDRAGEMVADILLRQGHHRIAYITTYYHYEWAQARYAGLARFYQQYGSPESVVELFSFGEIADMQDLAIAIMALPRNDLRALYSDRLSKEEMAGMLKNADRVERLRLKEKLGADAAVPTISAVAHMLAKLAKQEHDRYVYERMLERLLNISGDRSMGLYLHPFFKKVLSRSSATAWVCSDEHTARAALSFVRDQGKRVPEDISIVGFENWSAGYESQLTTYDFNMHGMVQQALQMILDEKTLKKTPAISEVDGYVVERRTTRR